MVGTVTCGKDSPPASMLGTTKIKQGPRALLERSTLMLEAQFHAELHLSRGIRLIADHTKLTGVAGARILIEACGRIRWLEVIEDVDHQPVEVDPHTLRKLGILGDRRVHIPARETANATSTTGVRVHTQYQPAEVAIHRCWVTKSIQPHFVAGATGPA